MAKQRKAWMPTSGKTSEASLPGTLKDEVETKAGNLIESVLKPMHVQPPPEGSLFNHITNITIQWLGSKCFFVSTYACPAPNANAPTFETKFARMEFVGNSRFTLSFLRHTGKWIVLYERLTVDECLQAIQNDPWFTP